MPLDITTPEEAHELLDSYTLNEVQQLWEQGAFVMPCSTAFLEYVAMRIKSGV